MQSNVTTYLELCLQGSQLPYLQFCFVLYVEVYKVFLTKFFKKFPPGCVGFGNCDVSVTVVM